MGLDVGLYPHPINGLDMGLYPHPINALDIGLPPWTPPKPHKAT